MLLRIFSIAIFMYTSLELQAQKDWELIKNKDGIKVSRKDSDSSAFKSIKVEGTFHGTWEKLVYILKDVKHHSDWVYKSSNVRFISSLDESDFTYYTVTEVPWPFENRDLIINMKFTEDNTGKIHRIVTKAQPAEIPVKAGIIRVPYFKAVWLVKMLDKNKMSITYTVSLNPGGSLPPWLMNTFAVKGPFETFRNLRELLKD
ncbi:MAG: START domain-containing protein [Chitinophagaceae bacterium]